MMRALNALFLVCVCAGAATAPAYAQRRGAPAPATAGPFTTPLSLAEMTSKQAVVNTTAGTIVIDLRPDLAPNHVGYFMKLAREHAYDGTTFHRVIRMAIVQAGDPLSKDPARSNQYGTGGLGMLRPEFSAEQATRGAVAAVLQPNKPDSAGSQFFICVTDQLALTGKYTIFGRVSEGMDIAQKISEAPADAEGRPSERIVITDVSIRDTPPPEPEPFANDSPAALAQYRAVLDTSLGAITVEFFPDKAPRARPQFSSTGTDGRLRRDGVSSSCARVCRADRRAHVTRADHGETAEVRSDTQTGVQRHSARERDPVDGARRRSGQRVDVVLHRDRECTFARRQIHRLWTRGRRAIGRRRNRAIARKRRDARRSY